MNDIKDLIDMLREESLYKDKASLEIMDLCMEAAEALENLDAQIDVLVKEDIEREALLWKWKTSPKYKCHVASLAQCIHDAPAADVVEVVHGRWEIYLGGKELMCSACKTTFWDEDGSGGSNYCPNCGGKMNGVKNDENANT